MARRIEKMWRNDVRAAEIAVRGACVGTQECASRPRHILTTPPHLVACKVIQRFARIFSPLSAKIYLVLHLKSFQMLTGVCVVSKFPKRK